MKAVLTADVVKSSDLGGQARLIRSLKYVLSELEDHGLIDQGLWQVFRGDSFQFVTSAKNAMLSALAIRTGLKGAMYRFASPLIREDMLDVSMDARIGIGIGDVEEIPPMLSESYGEAFTLSGILLDRIELEERRICMTTADDELNSHLDIVCRLAGVLINEWSENSSQALYRHFLKNETQLETARFLGITQSSVHHRLRIAHLDEIHYLLSYFKEQIYKKLKD